jgi:hypothetical protein
MAAVGVIRSWKKMADRKSFMCLAAFCGLFLLSWPPVAWIFMRALEAPYPPRTLPPADDAQAIVVFKTAMQFLREVESIFPSLFTEFRRTMTRPLDLSSPGTSPISASLTSTFHEVARRSTERSRGAIRPMPKNSTKADASAAGRISLASLNARRENTNEDRPNLALQGKRLLSEFAKTRSATAIPTCKRSLGSS